MVAVFSSTAIDRGIGIGRFGVEKKKRSISVETSFFARGQRAFKLVLKLSKEEEEKGRERERERKRKKKEKNEESGRTVKAGRPG